MLPAEQEEATFGDVCSLAFAALWARRVVRRGALLQAFGALSAAKARIVPDARSLDYARRVHARFVAARIWLPARYVCLFDSLCLMRVLLAQGVKADLVFGVRGRPFAAHCWVECESEILDEGGEACASFVEIVRV
ncbi:MAG: lasso peptide biosynthesis B2 protein [Terricaulis sp.]